VLPQARKLRDLKVVDHDLETPASIEESVRPIAAAELVLAAEEARAVVALPATQKGEELDRPEDYGLVRDTGRKINAG
jgi:hypothetical protein